MENTEVKRAKIFMVDDNVTNLMAGRNLLKNDYLVFPVTSAGSLFVLLEKHFPDLILLDIEMPEMNGYEALRFLKSDERYSDIPVIFLTAKNEEANELQGFDLGAVDYISKPFSPLLLKKRVENQLLILNQRETIREHADNLAALVHEKTLAVFSLQNAIIETVADLIEFRDDNTGGHSSRSRLFMEVMLNEVLQSENYADITYNWNMDFILSSSQLHDVGKIMIPDVILKKPGKLSPYEYETMKSHVTAGMKAIEQMMSMAPDSTFLQHAYNFVCAHHEKWDGSGYPAGLAGEAIPLEGRIMAIVDVYDALVSWRPYKKNYTHEETVGMILEGKGTSFEPGLVDIFISVEEKLKDVALSSRAYYK